jgi:hypothetical protein
LSDFEKFRLHGRYIAAILPLLLGYSVWAVAGHVTRWAFVAGALALVSFVFAGCGLYKLYPWDYPDAFGLFGADFRYWNFDGVLSWPAWWILGAGGLAYCVLLAFPRMRPAYVVFVIVFALSSHAQMRQWVDFQSGEVRATYEAATAIKERLGDVPEGSGLVLTLDRYGQTSYLLMTFDRLQYVRSVEAGRAFTAAQIPDGVTWIVAPPTVKVAVVGAQSETIGNQQLYRIPDSAR